MAMKIPDSPNVIGTQPVLRQVDSVNPNFERPNFKLDVSQPAQAIKDVGKAYADYVDYNTDIWMNAACTQWTHDMITEEQTLKDTHEGFSANDLYAKLEKKATALLDDMTGAPKDDKRIRIANPELQKRFRDWASKQMPAYQTRMMNYTASELDKANRKDLEQGIKDTNDFILGSSMEGAKEQFDVAWSNYQRAARLSAPGVPESYQRAEAARMMDEAVYAKLKVLNDNNIVEGLNWYYNVPVVRDALSSKSEAAFFADIEKNYVDQGGADIADDLATGGSGARPGGFLDINVLHAAFPKKSWETNEQYNTRIGSVYTKVYDKGREINDARVKAQQGMKEQQLASVQGKIITTNINDPMDVAATYREIANVDPNSADEYLRSVQKSLASQKTMDDFNTMFPNGDPREDMVSENFDESGTEAEYEELERTFKTSKGYYNMAGTKIGPFDTRVPAQKTIDEEFLKTFGTKKEYVQRRKDAFLYSSDASPLTPKEIEDLAAGKELERTNPITKDTNFRPNENPALSTEQITMLNQYDRIRDETAAWINSPVYAEYVAKASTGQYHGEDVPELRGLPLELRKNLGSITQTVDQYNEVVRLNPHLGTDVENRISANYKNKSTMAKYVYANNVKNEIVKAFEDRRAHGYSYPVKDSVEYNTILSEAVKNAESPSKALTERYINAEAANYLQTQKINPYLNPGAAREALDDVDALPMNVKVAKKIDKKTTAENWADAIINATPRAKRNRIKPYREAIIRTIEQTGNADVWYTYIDGIGEAQ